MCIDKKTVGQTKISRIGAKATVIKDELIAKTLFEAAKVIPGVSSYNSVMMSTLGSKSISNHTLMPAASGN